MNYKYWNEKTLGLDLEGLINDFKNAPDGTIVLLHTCAHNPTGVDPTHEEWDKIFEVVKAKKHFPIFDSAYQGFASGDVDKDAYAVRRWVEHFDGEAMICQSFAKNFGLYGTQPPCARDPGRICVETYVLLRPAHWSCVFPYLNSRGSYQRGVPTEDPR